MTINEIVKAPKAMTIGKASGRAGIDRTKAERILDPQGYFSPKKPTGKA